MTGVVLPQTWAEIARRHAEYGQECDVCGWCDTPGECVASNTCPRCGAAPGQQCRDGARLEKYHDERWALVPTREVNSMAGSPDPKDGAAEKKRSATATVEKPKAEKKGLDKGYVKSVVSRVEKGLKYSEIEREFVKAEKQIPEGFKSHYPAIRKAAIEHFGSVQKANHARAAAKTETPAA